MTADELRALQAPLKARYREDPASGLITWRSTGTLVPASPICRVQTQFGPFDAGLHPASGGTGAEKCSLDLLMEALISCAGVTFNVVALAMGVSYRSVQVIAECEADIRGTLGVAKGVPVGVQAIRLRFEVDSTEPDERLQRLLEQTERYCVVFQTLMAPPPVAVSLVRTGG